MTSVTPSDPTAPPLARALFDFESAPVWVMHCAEGPVPRAAADAVRALLARETQPWTMRWQEDFIEIPARARREAARLVGGDESDVALVATTSAGLGVVAQGLPWQAGDEVLVPLGEFPANSWPWLALRSRGVTLRAVPLWDGHRAGKEAWESTPPPATVDPEERLASAIGPRTRLIAASWVRFQDGLRLDLERLGALSSARGIPLVIDGVQGAGTLALDAPRARIAALSVGGHKGLLAPQGQGFLWTDREFRERLAPPGGWLSVVDAAEFARPSTDLDRAFLATGEALEMGVPNLLGAAALAASLALLNEAGPARIEAHVRRLQRMLLDRLASSSAWADDAVRLGLLWERGRLGSILALHHERRGRAALDALVRRGFEQGVFASSREGYLRVAFHGWHDESDIERIANSLC